jgi:hypothetical protein
MIILGMLNKGPLGEVLYKVSVESRIEMFRNSMRIALNNPFFGVGVDSLGDYYLLYKDAATVNGVNEFTDNAHNLYINYAATGGLLLALIQIILSIFCFISFFVIYKNVRHFDREIVSVFCLWCGYQAQSLISPTNISMMYWNMLFSGCLIGIARILLTKESINLQNKSKKDHYSRPVSYLLVLLIAAFMFPLFLVDKMQLDSAKLGDGNLAIKSATSYPESVVRYSRIGEALLNSKLNEAALGVARKATEFNPNAPSGWGLILVNNSAPYSERLQAKQKLIELDPTNIEVRNYIISLNNAIK